MQQTPSAAAVRSLEGLSQSTIDRATTAKFKIESYYKHLTREIREREDRYGYGPLMHCFICVVHAFLYVCVHRRKEVEQKATQAADGAKMLWEQLVKKEADYMRMQRVRMSVGDFTTVKVIGKGAFGEVISAVKFNLVSTRPVL